MGRVLESCKQQYCWVCTECKLTFRKVMLIPTTTGLYKCPSCGKRIGIWNTPPYDFWKFYPRGTQWGA